VPFLGHPVYVLKIPSGGAGFTGNGFQYLGAFETSALTRQVFLKH